MENAESDPEKIYKFTKEKQLYVGLYSETRLSKEEEVIDHVTQLLVEGIVVADQEDKRLMEKRE